MYNVRKLVRRGTGVFATVTMLLSLGLLADADVRSDIADRIETAVAAYKSGSSVEVNISDLNVNGVSAVSDAVEEFRAENPDCYYIGGGFNYYSSGSKVTRILLNLDTNKYSKRESFSRKVDSVVSGLDNSWNTTEKLLYFHDYLATHCQYDTNGSNNDAYECLVNGSSKCDGYARALASLCKKAGLKCDIITSRDNNHAWNLVTVDGSKYYMDVTWDDPVFNGSGQGMLSYVSHNNFLTSTAVCAENRHESNDWLLNGWQNGYGLGTSTKYDSEDFKKCTCAPVYIGSHKWLYGVTNRSGVKSVNLSTLASADYASTSNLYYPFMTGDENFVILGSNNKIYFLKSGESTVVYTLSSSDYNTGFVAGVSLSSDKKTVTYTLNKQTDITVYWKKGEVDISSYVGDITVTPTNTNTPTPKPTNTNTPTPKPTNTNTPTPKPTNTNTPTPKPTNTNTPTPKPTNTNTPTPKPTNTNTPTPKPTNTNTPTPKPTNTNTPTPKPTNTNTPTPKPTNTNTPTPKPTNTNTPTPKPTNTNTPTPGPTNTVKPTVTSKPSPTNTKAPTPTNTVKPTVTTRPSPTNTKTPTPTNAVKPTNTEAPVPTKTERPNVTSNPSITNSPATTGKPTLTPLPNRDSAGWVTSTPAPKVTQGYTPKATATPVPEWVAYKPSTATPTVPSKRTIYRDTDTAEPTPADAVVVTPGQPTPTTAVYSATKPAEEKVSAVKITEILNTDKGISLKWSISADAQFYNVLRSVNGSKYTLYKVLDSSVTAFLDNAVLNGSLYGYRIEAVNGEAWAQSEAASIFRLDTVKVKSKKSRKAKTAYLKWKKNSKASGYEIRYVLNNKVKTVTVNKSKSVSKTIKKLKSKKKYVFAVRAFKKTGKIKSYGAWSKTYKIKIK